MFNKDEKVNKETETVIGPSVKVKGDFKSEGNLLIEGEFEGTIETKGNIQAGQNSKILANIKANNVIILGSINGNLNLSGSLDVGERAIINGDITVTSLSVTHGAKINGQIKMLGNDEALRNSKE